MEQPITSKIAVVATQMDLWTRAENTAYQELTARMTLRIIELTTDLQDAIAEVGRMNANNRMQDERYNAAIGILADRNREISRQEQTIAELEYMLGIPPTARQLEYETDSNASTEYELEEMDV